MGQMRIPGMMSESCYSSEDVTRMVCVLIRKYGADAQRIARLMAEEHAIAGDRQRAVAWTAVSKRIGLLDRSETSYPTDRLH